MLLLSPVLEPHQLGRLVSLCHIHRKIIPLIRIISHRHFQPHRLVRKFRIVIFLGQMS